MNEGTLLRDLGAALAAEHAGEDWNTQARKLALEYMKLAQDEGVLIEDVRLYARVRDLPEPPSPNAWGALALNLAKQGFIVKTGEYRLSQYKRSHGRAQPVWRLK